MRLTRFTTYSDDVDTCINNCQQTTQSNYGPDTIAYH